MDVVLAGKYAVAVEVRGETFQHAVRERWVGRRGRVDGREDHILLVEHKEDADDGIVVRVGRVIGDGLGYGEKREDEVVVD